jgi:hypothetical protein
MTEQPLPDVVPDVVPVLAFEALDFIERVMDKPLSTWQRRIVIDTYGPGEPASGAGGGDD